MDRQLAERLTQLEASIGELQGKVDILLPQPMVQVTRAIDFRFTLAIGQGIRMSEPAPVDGFITEVTMHYPDGCNGLVDLALKYKNVNVFPLTDYVALNDATQTWMIRQPITKKNPIWVEMRNRDTLNTHTPSVQVVCIGVE
ncbi:MAG: hypothetical protein PHU95_03525 [Candidatus Thermoplasmatota archaeon]|nr:hypothetical protein [Candidatus Thermoplasmatota archaeon]